MEEMRLQAEERLEDGGGGKVGDEEELDERHGEEKKRARQPGGVSVPSFSTRKQIPSDESGCN